NREPDRGRRADEGIASTRSGSLCALCIRLPGVQGHRPVHGRVENPGAAAPRAVKTRSDSSLGRFSSPPVRRDTTRMPIRKRRMPTSQAKLSKQARKSGVSGVTHVAIIGAGRGGTALMEIFANDPLVDIVAVAEIDESAPGLALA